MLKRPKPRMLMLSLSFLSVLVLLLSACGPQGTPQSTGGNTPVKGGTWIDDVPAAPGSLLPQGSDTTYSVLIDQALYTPLFYGDALGHYHPGLLSDIPTVANGGARAALKNPPSPFPPPPQNVDSPSPCPPQPPPHLQPPYHPAPLSP